MLFPCLDESEEGVNRSKIILNTRKIKFPYELRERDRERQRDRDRDRERERERSVLKTITANLDDGTRITVTTMNISFSLIEKLETENIYLC